MTPLQMEFYARIGKTLLEIQLAERQIQMCLSYFLPTGEVSRITQFESLVIGLFDGLPVGTSRAL
jgi:hypothetical protein